MEDQELTACDRRKSMAPGVVAVLFLFMMVGCARTSPPLQPVHQNGWIKYQDSWVTQTIPCTQEPIFLAGNHTSLTLKGGCTHVQVAGEHNDILIETLPQAIIEITGAHNDVTWHQIAPGPPPQLSNRGYSNTFHTWTPGD